MACPPLQVGVEVEAALLRALPPEALAAGPSGRAHFVAMAALSSQPTGPVAEAWGGAGAGGGLLAVALSSGAVAVVKPVLGAPTGAGAAGGKDGG